MTESDSLDRIDIPFSVPFVHRLRFTNDVFGADSKVLAEVLQPSPGQAARIQFWIDANVVAGQPDLLDRIRAFAEGLPNQISLMEPIELVPGGEAIKNDLDILKRMLRAMNESALDRRSYIVVIGGGAVLDSVGFATSVAHRGIRLVRLPSTTLGQDDSGVGVKNGVNLYNKKNWLGSFAVPWAVINDASLLKSLSDRDFACGFSEAVKVAMLKDAALFDRLCDVATRIRDRDMEAAGPVIRRSAELHLDHITRGGDPFEMEQARPLDFGHWSAHKLEAMTGFQIRHGEAVAIGVAIDAVYSSLTQGFPAEDANRVLRCMSDLGLRLSVPDLADTHTLFGGLEEFRQHLGGQMTLTMVRSLGDPVDVHEIAPARMREAIDRVMSFDNQ